MAIDWATFSVNEWAGMTVAQWAGFLLDPEAWVGGTDGPGATFVMAGEGGVYVVGGSTGQVN